MWLEFKKLLWMSWHSAMAAGSSTGVSVFWLGFGVLFLTLLVAVALEWILGGRSRQAFTEAMSSWKSYAAPFLALLSAWIVLWGYSIVKTVYDDHRFLAGQRRYLQEQVQHWKNIAETPVVPMPEVKRVRVPAYVTSPAPTTPPPQLVGLRIASQETIQSTDPELPYGLHVAIQTDLPISPAAFLFRFDGVIGKIIVHRPTSIAMEVSERQPAPNEYLIAWANPPFTSSSSLNVYVPH
jgi:hypothetical protein